MRHAPIAFAVVVAACSGGTTQTHVPPPPLGTAHPDRAVTDDALPELQLPADVTPTAYTLSLNIDPRGDTFSGEVRIAMTLAQEREVIWLHAQDMQITSASFEPEHQASFEARVETTGGDHDGVAGVRAHRTFPAGQGTLHIAWTTHFDRTLKGLYKVDAGGEHYAFTQFEAISARYAFPCFDEPRFKTPFDVTITAKAGDTVIANTRPLATTPNADGTQTVHFAPTLPLPTYLVAWAVGPLDVVDAPAIPPNDVRQTPIPLRGVTVKGRGHEIQFALDHTPEIVAQLESYFGIAYPYDKLDLIAVPDFAAGAMENAGAITFREWLILVDPAHAPEEQVRAYFGVTAHELAHQWFGDLVTMPWWNDIWLNEAFATWMGEHVVERLHPEWHSEIGYLWGIEGAMGQDALVSARRIREPIQTSHDIRNAFDGITYQKGGGVLSMFEHYMGEDHFRDGIHRYLVSHRFATATSDDLLASLSEAWGHDVATPFKTFLDQPGVPLVHASLECQPGQPPALHVSQERYFPVGSQGHAGGVWSIPVCVRYGAPNDLHEKCELVTQTDAHVSLDGVPTCPGWVMPNAGGYGYYRFAMSGEDLAHLGTAGYAQLSPREKLAYGDAIVAGFAADAIHADEALPALAPLAREPYRALAQEPMGLVRFSREYVADDALRPRVERWAQQLYAPVVRDLGWGPRRGATEDGERKLLRASVLDFAANVARDPAVRREAARRGRAWLGAANGDIDPSAVSPELAGVAVNVALEDGDAALFDLAVARFRATDDAVVRNRILGAVGATHDAALATRALDLSLDPALHVNEVLTPLGAQMDVMERREDAWGWLETHIDPISERVATTRAADLPWFGARFCDEAHATRLETFFGPRIGGLAGGPRNLAGSTEVIRLCASRVAAQGDSVRGFFAGAHR